ncbi:MAG: hypothetical protein RJA70_1169 [Pseudomonadota bacterium]|jgi:uncharacterized membrane protein (UPF0136 family)
MILVASAVFGFFGAFSIVGGVIGFKKAGSTASLVAGGLSGVVLLAAAGIAASGSAVLGLGIGVGASLLLAGRFVPAYLKTKKVMPQGIMAALSVLALIIGALALMTSA